MRATTAPKGGFFRSLGRVMNRAVASAGYRLHVAAANVWRDSYNPLRGLTIQRAVSLLEAGERGEFADLQWTYRYIEMQNPTLGALVERRTSAIQRLDWDIKIRDRVPEGKAAVAERQAAALRAAYERLSNLSEALEFLALADFRGFSHLEKIRQGGQVVRLSPVDQWFWVRQGLYGRWQLNRDATFGVNRGEDVDLSRFVIREVARPINRVALVCHVRQGLSEKDYDAFIEVFGVPCVFVVMPESVPADYRDEYLEMADEVAGDGRGVLPGGSKVETVDNGARGSNPFTDHIKLYDEKMVLRGTGGKLTMLAESGSGTLAGGAHAETFLEIAQATAREISEVLQRDVDAEVIEEVTPGEPPFAYFQLAATEETDVGAIVRDVATLQRAGYQVAPAWLAEKTGYEVTLAGVTGGGGAFDPDPLRNRAQAANGWRKFARETGTLGIPREVMPQIDQGNRASMVNFLRARGINYRRERMKPADLKPSQAEYSPEKVEAAKLFKGTPRALLISADNHVIDGHHQYLAALQTTPNQPIEVMRLKAPAMQVIGTLLAMPSTTTAEMPPVRNRETDEVKEALAEAVGVQAEFLAPVDDLIGRLAEDVHERRMSDAEWLRWIEEAAIDLPEFFDPAKASELAEAFEAAMGGEALRAVRTAQREISKDTDPEE